MNRSYRPLLITVGALAGFAAIGVAVGQGGWGTPAANEQAIGEISRWCERVSGGFLREPVNTLGNLGFVVAGLAMFWILGRDTARGGAAPNRFRVLTPISILYAAAVVFLGPGSMVMHGTHTFFGAWIDNVSMVAYITIPWVLNLAGLGRWPDRRFFTVYAAVVTAYATGYWILGPDLGVGFELFKVSIPLWIISETLYRWWSPRMRWLSGFTGFVVAAAFGITPVTMIRHPGEYWWFFLFWLPGLVATHPAAGRRRYTPWFWAGIASFMLAYAIWLTGNPDSRWCHPDSLIQAHAIWHLLTALATWCFFLFLRTERAGAGDAWSLCMAIRRHHRMPATTALRAASVLLVIAFPVIVWWLIGDLSSPGGSDRIWRLPQPHGAAETVLGIGATALVLLAAAVIWRTGASWLVGRERWKVLTRLLTAGALLGFEIRVVTAATVGANIGGGALFFVGTFVIMYLMARAIEEGRRLTRADQDP